MLFKKKKIYKVEYKNNYGDYCSCVVKAYDESGAWKATEGRYLNKWEAQQCISITELKDA